LLLFLDCLHVAVSSASLTPPSGWKKKVQPDVTPSITYGLTVFDTYVTPFCVFGYVPNALNIEHSNNIGNRHQQWVPQALFWHHDSPPQLLADAIPSLTGHS
jgi:hypothetical protein